MRWLSFRGSEQLRQQYQPYDQEMRQALKDAHEEVLALRAKIAEYQWLEECLRQRTRQLNERMKELACLYSIAACFSSEHLPLEQILSAIVDKIPEGWQIPKATCARILLYDKAYASPSFRQTSAKQTAPIHVDGKPIGRIEVCLLPELRRSQGISFLQEERNLLNAIALCVAGMISSQKAADPLT